MNVALNFMHAYHFINVPQHSFGIRRFDCHYILCLLKSSDWLWWVTESDFPAGVSRATRLTRCSNHQSPDNSDAQIASCKGDRNTHAFSYMQYPKVLISFCWILNLHNFIFFPASTAGGVQGEDWLQSPVWSAHLSRPAITAPSQRVDEHGEKKIVFGVSCLIFFFFMFVGVYVYFSMFVGGGGWAHLSGAPGHQ